MQRRDFMASVAGVAATRWETEDYDPENVDEWDPISSGHYQTGVLEAEELSGSADGPTSRWAVDDGQLDERRVSVWYSRSGPHLDVEGESEDGSFRHGLLAQLEPEDARQLGAALFQAAWEFENRDVEESGQ